MKTLTIQQVLFIHSRLIAETGGAAGLRDIGLLESAIASPFASFGGQDAYPGLFDKTAALFDSLVNNHAFVDGSKRVGITAAAMLVRINGFSLKCTQAELVEITLQTATRHPSIDELAHWFANHCLADQIER